MRRTLSLLLALAITPAVASAVVNLTDPQGYLWDIDDQGWGVINNGTSDAFDYWPQLCVTTDLSKTGVCSGGETYDANGASSTTEDGGREVVTATITLGANGLDVYRKVYVPDTGSTGFVRYLEVITNNTGASVTFKVRGGSVDGDYSDLGSDSGTQVTGTSDGTGVVGPGLDWFTTDDSNLSGGDPSLAHVLGNGFGSVLVTAVNGNAGGQGSDGFDFEWGPITLADGETAIVAHAISQQPNDTAAVSVASSLAQLPPEVLSGMSLVEQLQVVNFGVPNSPPVASPGGPYVGLEGTPVSLDGSGSSDPDGAVVLWEWDCDDDGTYELSSGSGTGDSCLFLDEGTYSVGLRVTDDQGATDTTTATLDVANVAPIVTNAPSTTALVEGVAWSYLPVVDDPGADTLTFSLGTGAPGGLTIDAVTGQMDWTPTWSDAGTWAFDLVVDDGDLGIDTVLLILTVSFIDADADAMPDTWESANGLDPSVDDASLDPDADGLTNLDEFLGGSDPQSYDGPSAPVLVAPIGGAEVAVATPALTWTNAADPQGDALTYEVELYDDASLTTLLDSTSGLTEDGSGTTAWTPTVAVAENATGWWRVRADDGNVAGTWTALESYFVNETNEAPDAVVPAAPLAGDTVAVDTPDLGWVAGSDVDGDALTYDVRLWDAAGTTVVTEATGLTGTTWTVDLALTEDASYTWDVRAVDEHGLEGPWSTPQLFGVNTSNQAPPDLAFVAPLDGAQVEPQSPDLVVTAVQDGDGDVLDYVFELDTAQTFDTAALVTVVAADAGGAEVVAELATEGVVLDENTLWYARARVEDPAGATSAWAEISFFVRGPNDPPAAPVLVAPDDGTSQQDGRPWFVVGHAADPEGDAVTYDVLVFRDAEGTDPAASIEGLAPGAGDQGTADQTSGQTDDALEPGDYWWTARAVDDGGAGTEAAALRALTIESAPGDDDDSAGDDDDSVGDDDDLAIGDDDDDRDEGCACDAGAAGPASLWWLALLLPVLRRRR